MRIDGKEISLGGISRIDWHAWRNHPATRAAFTQRIWSQAGIGWPRTEGAIPRQMAQEHILRKCVIEQSPSGADHGLSLARHVVSSGHPGSEVIQILAIQLAGGNVVSAVSVIDGVELAALFSGYAEVVPAHPVVHSQPGSRAKAVLNKQPIAILVGVSFGIALDLAPAAVRNPFQEGRQAGETQRAPEVVIEHLRDGSAPELVAEFHVVLSRLPGIVVNEVPVGVDAIFRQRVGGADLRETANIGRWKAAVIGGGYARIQTNGVRDETLVLGEKSFSKSVPSQTS